jgi:hypothetical protein
MITIEVVDSRGRPVSGADVQISWRSWTHSTGRTDSRGRVSWNVSSGSGTVYVDGRKVYDGEVRGSLRVRK